MGLSEIKNINNYNNMNFQKLHYIMLLELEHYFNNY